EIRRNAIQYLQEKTSDNQADLKIAKADEQTRNRIAAQYRAMLAATRDQHEIARLQHRIATAQADNNARRLTIQQLTNESQALAHPLRDISAYRPACLYGAYLDALTDEDRKLSYIWEALPKDLTTTTQLHAPPHYDVLQSGKIPEGRDHRRTYTLLAVV